MYTESNQVFELLRAQLLASLNLRVDCCARSRRGPWVAPSSTGKKLDHRYKYIYIYNSKARVIDRYIERDTELSRTYIYIYSTLN